MKPLEVIADAEREVYVRISGKPSGSMVNALKRAGGSKVKVVANRREDVEDLIKAGIPVWVGKNGVSHLFPGIAVAVDGDYIIESNSANDSSPKGRVDAEKARRLASDCRSLMNYYQKQ
jgi:hypothetical protein